HGVGLPRPRHPEQGHELLAPLDALHQLRDGLGLVPGGFKVGNHPKGLRFYPRPLRKGRPRLQSLLRLDRTHVATSRAKRGGLAPTRSGVGHYTTPRRTATPPQTGWKGLPSGYGPFGDTVLSGKGELRCPNVREAPTTGGETCLPSGKPASRPWRAPSPTPPVAGPVTPPGGRPPPPCRGGSPAPFGVGGPPDGAPTR